MFYSFYLIYKFIPFLVTLKFFLYYFTSFIIYFPQSYHVPFFVTIITIPVYPYIYPHKMQKSNYCKLFKKKRFQSFDHRIFLHILSNTSKIKLKSLYNIHRCNKPCIYFQYLQSPFVHFLIPFLVTLSQISLF